MIYFTRIVKILIMGTVFMFFILFKSIFKSLKSNQNAHRTRIEFRLIGIYSILYIHVYNTIWNIIHAWGDFVAYSKI